MEALLDEKKLIRRCFRYILIGLLLSSVVSTIMGCGGGGGDDGSSSNTGGDNNNGGDTSGQAKWTYMVYIAGDNDLSTAAVVDINEMEQVGSDSNLNIVIQAEFSSQYSPNMPQNTQRGKITKDSNIGSISSTLTDIGNKDMGDKKTLTEFIQWAAANYPADHYALVLWDHGMGWKLFRKTGDLIRGALQDQTSDSFMSLSDLAAGVSESLIHFDVINFDACLMAMYEVAYEFNGLADYLVFSEEIESGDGDPYDTILQSLSSNPKQSAQELATTITSNFKAYS